MDMKAQGSRNGKALGIGELLASACSTSALLDRSCFFSVYMHGMQSNTTESKISRAM